ncbi:MAG: autotransporter-associated beta strand repeat-containing protein [Akkermansiaceae bacterium]|nr:autotransporter-associated beta strand repeat-containing protein [Akkermansiaceae bacterium]
MPMTTAWAADRTWTAATSTDWNDTTNWDVAPTVDDNLNVNWYGGPPGFGLPVLSADETLPHGNDLKIGLFGGTGEVHHTAGTATIGTLSLGWAGGTGTYDLADTSTTGGALTGFGTGSGSLTVTNRIAMGHLFGGSDGGAATFNINTTGALAVANNFEVAVGDKGVDDGLCTVNLDAGAVTAANLSLGLYDDADAGRPGVPKGIFNQGGGSVTLTDRLHLGQGSQNGAHATDNEGIYTLSAGTLTTDSTHSEFWHSGISMASANWNGVNGSGSGNNGGIATFNLDGGVVSTHYVFSSDQVDNLGTPEDTNDDVTYTRGTSIFNFNGGTLQAQASRLNPWEPFIYGGEWDSHNGLTHAYVKSGGAVIDSNGFDIRVEIPLEEDPVSTGGGLTKEGTGILLLTRDNTITGPVVVNEGTLRVTAGNAATDNAFSYCGGIIVNDGGTLRATGNALFGWDGSQAKPITIHTGGVAIAETEDQVVSMVTLDGGELATEGAIGDWGSWNFGRATVKELLVTENSVVSAEEVGFHNGAFITVETGKTLDFTGTITDSNDGISSVQKWGEGTVVLSGANGYTGETRVAEGVVSLTSPSLADTSSVSIDDAFGATLDLDFSGGDKVASLYIDGFLVADDVTDPGTYGALGSGADHEISAITGSGLLFVGVDLPSGGYSEWASVNVGGQTADQDFNEDGVSNGIAYFMDNTGRITLPGIAGGVISFTNGGNIPSGDYGTRFWLETAQDLDDWTPVDVGDLDANTDGPGGSLAYTLPTGMGKWFVRLVVAPD